MGALSIWHWLIVLAVVLLLFGSKKLPDAARGLGRSMRIFKSEMKEMQNDGSPAETDEPQALTQGQPNAAQYVQPQSQQPAPAPQYQQPVSQPQPHPQQHQTPAAPQQPQQHSDPTAPYQGGQGQ
ncbi:Sec-independent protein translocase subunit TatA [Dietzia aurantiaca]|uniref:Sec-independent protein translocase protein TatA n=1 Tax=Dietzia aurantiaca TaxID=983873 RepID=A0ABV9PTY9_9ACTN